MKRIFFSLLVCGMFWTGVNAQTKADDSGVWIISGGGKEPSRFFLLADENSIKQIKVGSKNAVDVAIRFVVENHNSYTGLLSGNARVYCEKGTISGSNLVMSNKGKVSRTADVSEQKPEDEGDRQIIKFVCNQGERQRVFPPTEDSVKIGFVFIGQKETDLEAEDFVRDVLWSNKAIARMKEDLKTRQEILDFMQTQIDHLKSVANMAKDMKAQMEDEARRAKERRDGPRVRRINNLIGLTENDVVKYLGNPYSYKDDQAGNRWISYYQYKDSRQIITRGNMQFPTGDLLECNVTFLISKGKVYDYTVNENVESACAELGF